MGPGLPAEDHSDRPKGPRLGDLRDREIDARLPLDGSGDDATNLADEDGVAIGSVNAAGDIAVNYQFVSQKHDNNTGEIVVDVQNIAPGESAFVSAWIDWDRSGTFDVDERILAGETVTDNKAYTYNFNVPLTSEMAAGTSYVRVRIHSGMMGDPQELPTGGHANDGEVEDYAVNLVHGTEIHGIKFEDVNGNGVQDPEDTPLEGVAINLLDQSGDHAVDLHGDPVGTQYTDADGAYWFINLAGGTYTVAEDLAASKVGGDDGVSDVDQGLTASLGISTILLEDLAQGDCVEDVNFFNYIAGSIHGYKFHDLDASGTQDPGEPDQIGVEFDLYRWVSTETIDPPSADPFVVHDWEYVKSETSDSHGRFWFTGLEPGKYVVREALAGTEWIQTTDQAQGSPDTNYEGKGVLPTALGEDPNDPATGTFLIESRIEYAHEPGGHIMYMDLNDDGNIDAAEKAAAEQLQALKTPIVEAERLSPTATICRARSTASSSTTSTTTASTRAIPGWPASPSSCWTPAATGSP